MELRGPLAEDLYGGADGIAFGPGGTLFIVHTLCRPALFTAVFDDDYRVANLTPVFDHDNMLSFQTTAALSGEYLYVVDGQLDKLLGDIQPELPFHLLKVPVYDLLRCGCLAWRLRFSPV